VAIRGAVWQGDWSYPMSLDAHVFRTAEHSELALGLDYFNPNTLEGNMAVFCYAGNSQCPPRLACYPGSRPHSSCWWWSVPDILNPHSPPP
jgi:hypothetical protein